MKIPPIFHQTWLLYSCLPNTWRGWNNGIGWKIPKELTNVGDGINVLDIPVKLINVGDGVNTYWVVANCMRTYLGKKDLQLSKNLLKRGL